MCKADLNRNIKALKSVDPGPLPEPCRTCTKLLVIGNCANIKET